MRKFVPNLLTRRKYRVLPYPQLSRFEAAEYSSYHRKERLERGVFVLDCVFFHPLDATRGVQSWFLPIYDRVYVVRVQVSSDSTIYTIPKGGGVDHQMARMG